MSNQNNNNNQPISSSDVIVSPVPPYQAVEAAEIERLVSEAQQSPVDDSNLVCDLECLALLDHQERTDNQHAAQFAKQYQGVIMFVDSWGVFHYWDGRCWMPDHSESRVTECARKFADSLWETHDQLENDESVTSDEQISSIRRFITRQNNVGGLSATVSLAKSAPEFRVHHEELNANTKLVNLQNGTFDLETMSLRSHDPRDKITQIANASYDPNADCPRWLEFLNVTFANDVSLIRYVQQLFGYALSGECIEAILVIAVGRGNNGKSTLWNVIHQLLGSYSLLASDSLLMGTGTGHTTDKASLYQKRFVAIAEGEEHVSLKEAKVKELTGELKLTARRLYENPFEFTATHTFLLTSNSLPTIKGTDNGIWRRIKVIPFGVNICDVCVPDPGLRDWLITNEASGIFNWMLAGRSDWKANGFVEPDIVRRAVLDYRSDEDEVGRFLTEKCEEVSTGTVGATFLFQQYKAWGGVLSQPLFGKKLKDKGFDSSIPQSGMHRKTTVYHGLRFVDPFELNSVASRVPATTELPTS